MGGPLHIWANRSASGCFQVELELEKAVTFLLHGICQQLLHGASHFANPKGVRPQGSTSHVCCPCWSQADLGDFIWDLEVIIFISSSTLTVTECWRTAHWIQEEEAISHLWSQKTWFWFLSFQILRESGPSCSAWCTVGPLLFTRKRGNGSPSSPLWQFWHLCEYGIYCQDHAVLVRWQIWGTAAWRTACGIKMSLCPWRNELQGATWGFRTSGALEEAMETASRWTNQNMCFLQKNVETSRIW